MLDYITPQTEAKYNELKQFIAKINSVAVAYSGGIDSSLLAKVCFDVLGKHSLAITVVSPLLPKKEIEDASAIASLIGVKHVVLENKEIGDEVRKNLPDRCYFCKKSILRNVVDQAKLYGINNVVEGSNIDDLNDYRPGAKVTNEFLINSPLQIIGFTKSEIRELSRFLKLPNSEKPAYSCLASRIPYYEDISEVKLKRIEKAEIFLQSLGFLIVRVRAHDTIARIEVAPNERQKLFSPELMDHISRELKSYGFLYVCTELEGYSMGNLNNGINKKG